MALDLYIGVWFRKAVQQDVTELIGMYMAVSNLTSAPASVSKKVGEPAGWQASQTAGQLASQLAS